MKPKLIALDLDGTLLLPDKSLSARNRAALDAAAAFALRQLGAHEGFGIALVVDDVCLDCAPKGVRDSLLAKAVLDEPLMELLARLLTDACKFQNLLEGL